jgi:hypothetical protein
MKTLLRMFPSIQFHELPSTMHAKERLCLQNRKLHARDLAQVRGTVHAENVVSIVLSKRISGFPYSHSVINETKWKIVVYTISPSR